jgi:hypothetical protein
MIQAGTAFYDTNTPGWTLNTGTGDRSFTSPDIRFDPPFQAPPKIAVSLAGLDGERVRVGLGTFDIQADEFNVVIYTWWDTALYGVRVTWIAFD